VVRIVREFYEDPLPPGEIKNNFLKNQISVPPSKKHGPPKDFGQKYELRYVLELFDKTL
jgi:hypothetical protein